MPWAFLKLSSPSGPPVCYSFSHECHTDVISNRWPSWNPAGISWNLPWCGLYMLRTYSTKERDTCVGWEATWGHSMKAVYNSLHRCVGNIFIGQEWHACRQDTRYRQQYFPCRNHSIPGCWEDPEVILYDGSPMEEYRIVHIFIRLLCVVHFSHLAEFTSGILVHLSDYLHD